jgi:hypothetical protein
MTSSLSLGQVSTWTELFGLGFGGNTSNKGPQSLKLQLYAEFNCVHLLTYQKYYLNNRSGSFI